MDAATTDACIELLDEAGQPRVLQKILPIVARGQDEARGSLGRSLPLLDSDGVHNGIDGGEGVGRVTKPGLDQPVGFAAINRVPRRMIEEQVQQVWYIHSAT